MPSKTTILSIVSLAMAACADDPRPHDRSNPIVDHGDGTYSQAAAPDLDTTTTRTEGALTWTYVGQARHSWAPAPMTTMSYVTRGPRPDDGPLGMKREDADGSVWEVTAFDAQRVDAEIERANAASIEFQRGLHLDDPSRDVTTVEPIGLQKTVTTHSWTVDSCENAYYMGDDDRVQVAVNTDRRKAVVEIGWFTPGTQCPYDGDYIACLQAGETVEYCKAHVLNCVETPGSTSTVCSGTILREQWVLTAAHCVYDEDNNSIASSKLKVRRADGVQAGWLSVTSKFVDAGFAPGASLDPTDDWVLLKLTAPLAAPFSDMDISGASDTTLASLPEIVNLAFPGFAPQCTTNPEGVMWMHNVGELGSIYAAKVNFKLDSGPRASGSPVFFCPGGDGDDLCEGTELGHVIGIITGYDGFQTTVVGPKGPEQRANAITIMNSN